MPPTDHYIMGNYRLVFYLFLPPHFFGPQGIFFPLVALFISGIRDMVHGQILSTVGYYKVGPFKGCDIQLIHYRFYYLLPNKSLLQCVKSHGDIISIPGPCEDSAFSH